jgi:8-oxo-dGTP pyrophosphatase MutT (NUDIX family)
MPHTWKPSVTVAAIIERDGRFLLIEEETSEGVRLNQPAGHLDPLETLEQAVVREVLEETAHDFTPTRWWACTCRATARSGAAPT